MTRIDADAILIRAFMVTFLAINIQAQEDGAESMGRNGMAAPVVEAPVTFRG